MWTQCDLGWQVSDADGAGHCGGAQKGLLTRLRGSEKAALRERHTNHDVEDEQRLAR